MGNCAATKDSVLHVSVKPRVKTDTVEVLEVEDTRSDDENSEKCFAVDDTIDTSSDQSFDSNSEMGSETGEETSNLKQFEILLNGEKVMVSNGESIFEASLRYLNDNEAIPTLCHHPYLPSARLYQGKCGICEVYDKKKKKLVRSCKTIVTEGMEVESNHEKVEENISNILKRKLSYHVMDCMNCEDNGSCMFQNLLNRYHVTPQSLQDDQKQRYMKSYMEAMSNKVLIGNEAVTFDVSKCIKCYRCIRVCEYVQGMSVQTLNENEKRSKSKKGVSVFRDIEDYHSKMYETDCINCGQCSFVCPVGAISATSQAKEVMKLLKNKSMTLVASTAPAVRVTLSEAFGKEPSAYKDTQIVTALKKLGFEYVFDTQFTADLTIIEEAAELIRRVKKGGPWPLFTSCCPSWINLMEQNYPEFIENVSTCKSPQQMMGALIKSYWTKQMNIKRDKVVNVSIMPCTAKKGECKRKQMLEDVDYVLTTRELAYMLKTYQMDVQSLTDTDYDSPLGESTGGAALFGASGGVMEAALRTAYKEIMGKNLPSLEFKPVRGLRGYKETSVELKGGLSIDIKVINSGKNIKDEMSKILEGRKKAKVISKPAFIEMMACPGGCIGGGGNPKFKMNQNNLIKRLEAVYQLDKEKKIKGSHENPAITKLYETFLGEPGKGKAHHLLHTKYVDRKRYLTKTKLNSLLI